MRRSVKWLTALVLCGMILSSCDKTGELLDEGLPAAATAPTSLTVAYRTEETTVTEAVTLPEIESTKRTASTEDMPFLATTTPTSPTEPTEPDGEISVLPDVPNIPIGQFTTTQASYPVPDNFTSTSAGNTGADAAGSGSTGAGSTGSTGAGSTGDGGTSASAGQVTTAATVSNDQGIYTMPPLTEEAETADPFASYTTRTRTQRPYVYSTLNEKGKYVYDAIISAAQKGSAYVDLTGIDGVTKDDYCDIYSLVYNDENSMYYLDVNMQYSFNPNTQNVRSATIFYKYTSAERQRMQAEIDSETANILSKITPGMSQYDIVKTFYDYLAENVVYDEDAPNCSDIYGVFVDKRAICGGYSKAFSYLCDKVGIETLTVIGDADNIPHMWNMIKLGGDWYHIDITYAVTDSKLGQYVRYDYFCVTDDVINRSRIVYDQPYAYPKAAAQKCNYFVKNRLVANSYDEAYKMLYDGIIDASFRKELAVQIRCGSKEVYDAVSYELFSPSRKQVLELMEDALAASANKYKCDNISYGQDNNAYVIRLFLEYTN